MRTKHLRHYLLAGLFIAGSLFTGCKKEEEDSDTQTSSDNALAESVFTDVSNIVDDGARNKNGIYKTNSPHGHLALAGGCVTVNADTVKRIMDWDWGATNCLGGDGRYRKGKIRCAFSGPYSAAGTSATITFTDFYVNDYKVEGSIIITNNVPGNTSRTIEIKDGKLTNPIGKSISWTATHTINWIAGNTTDSLRTDDVYEVTGTSRGSSTNGNSFSTNIPTSDPLRMDLSCAHITKGKFELTPSGKQTRTFDFGDGTCDNKATLTINGKTFNITLH